MSSFSEFQDLSDEVRCALVSGDVATIERSCNTALARWTEMVAPDAKVNFFRDYEGMEVVSKLKFEKVRGRMRTIIERSPVWKILLQDITRVPIKVEYLGQEHFDAEWESDEYPRAYSEELVDPATWKTISGRYATLTHPGHFLRFRNTMWVLRMAGGPARTAVDPIWGRLAYYFDSLSVDEPFVEANGQNAIKITCKDAAVGLRFQLMVNAWWMSESFGNRDMIIEIMEYLFQDPIQRSKKLKDALSVVRQSAFCLTEHGKCVIYDAPGYQVLNPVLTGYTVDNVPGSDVAYYVNLKNEIKEALDFLKSEKLTLTREMSVKLIDAELNDKNLSDLVLLGSVIAMAGFSRTREEIAFYGLQHATDDANISSPPFEQDLADEWEEAMQDAFKNHKILSYDALRALAPTFVTPRSSGGYKAKVTFDIPSGVNSLEDRKLEATLTSKVGIFMNNPEAMLTKEAISSRYTELNPGTLGRRHVVGGRSTRSIAARRLPHFLGEGVFALGLNDYVNRQAKSYAPIGSTADFHFGSERNAVLVDHGYGAMATTRDDIVNDISDYSSFDFTQRESNVRRIARESVIKFLKLAGLIGAWGPFSSLEELVSVLWGPGVTFNAAFKVPMTDDVVLLDQLQSGEFLTAVVNSLTNRANVKLQERRRNDTRLSDILKLLGIKILGDDLVRFIQVATGNKWTADVADKVAQIHMDVSTENGFIQQRTKSVMRLYFYEFLKKSFVYGVHVPLMQMQPVGAEKNEISVSVTERMRGYYAKLQTSAMRGLDHDLANNIMTWTYALRRGVQSRDRLVRRIYYPPMATLYTPSSWNGIGIVPFTLHAGASLDGVIASYCATDMEWRRAAEIAGTISNIRSERVTQRVARNAAAGVGVYPSDAFERGVEFMKSTLLPPRITASLEAEKWLLDNSHAPPMGYGYTSLPKKQVSKIIENEPSLRTLLNDENRLEYRKMERNRKGPITRSFAKDFGWLMSMGYLSEDVEPLRTYEGITPVAGLDDLTSKLLVEFGVGADPDVWKVSANDIMQLLRRGDRYARRDITSEELFKILLRDDFLDSPEAVVNVLVYMGYNATTAVKVAKRLVSDRGSSIQLRKAARLASTAGGFTSWINQGVATYSHLIDGPDFIRPQTNAILQEVMFSRCICESFRRRKITGVKVVPSAASGALADRTIAGPLRKDWIAWAMYTPYH